MAYLPKLNPTVGGGLGGLPERRETSHSNPIPPVNTKYGYYRNSTLYPQVNKRGTSIALKSPCFGDQGYELSQMMDSAAYSMLFPSLYGRGAGLRMNSYGFVNNVTNYTYATASSNGCTFITSAGVHNSAIGAAFLHNENKSYGFNCNLGGTDNQDYVSCLAYNGIDTFFHGSSYLSSGQKGGHLIKYVNGVRQWRNYYINGISGITGLGAVTCEKESGRLFVSMTTGSTTGRLIELDPLTGDVLVKGSTVATTYADKGYKLDSIPDYIYLTYYTSGRIHIFSLDFTESIMFNIGSGIVSDSSNGRIFIAGSPDGSLLEIYEINSKERYLIGTISGFGLPDGIVADVDMDFLTIGNSTHSYTFKLSDVPENKTLIAGVVWTNLNYEVTPMTTTTPSPVTSPCVKYSDTNSSCSMTDKSSNLPVFIEDN